MPRTYEGWSFTPAERQLLDAQYAGRSAPLRPIVEKLTEAALQLGEDVEIEVRPDEVRFLARFPFALVHPSSATRLDVGLALSAWPESDRLLEPGGLEAEGMTRRVPLEELDDVDGELLRWLAQAYEQGGE